MKLAGLRFKKNTEEWLGNQDKTIRKKSKKRDEEDRQERAQCKKKVARMTQSESSSSSNVARAGTPFASSLRARDEERREIKTQPGKARQQVEDGWMQLAITQTSTGKRSSEEDQVKLDSDKPKLSDREYNPFLRGENSNQPVPCSSGAIPRHLTVGDGGAAWRRRAIVRSKHDSKDEALNAMQFATGRSQSSDCTVASTGKSGLGHIPPSREETDASKCPLEHPEQVIRRMQEKYGAQDTTVADEKVALCLPAAEEEDANALGALAMQAMLSGDMARYEELNQKLEQKQIAMAEEPSCVPGTQRGGTHFRRSGEQIKVFEEVDAAGRKCALVQSVQVPPAKAGGRNKRGHTNIAPGTAGGGFYEDDNVSLDELTRRERILGVQDYNGNLERHILKKGAKFRKLDENEDEAYALGWYENVEKNSKQTTVDKRGQQQDIRDKKTLQRNLEACPLCMESKRFAHQGTIVSNSTHAYMCMERFKQCVLPKQLFIAPVEHVLATTDMEEDAFLHLRNYQKCLVRFFEQQSPSLAPLFIEVAAHKISRDQALLGAGAHAKIVVYPVEMGVLAEARAFWKKALDEAESEFITQHKRVIETDMKGGARAAIPKGFPYVHVDFSLGGGFVHIIEDVHEFPHDFVQHTIAGMCELTILDRAYASKDEYERACQELKREFTSGFDWTQAH